MLEIASARGHPPPALARFCGASESPESARTAFYAARALAGRRCALLQASRWPFLERLARVLLGRRYGRFATVANLEFATAFMKAVRSSVRKRFEKIQAFYVGAEAAQMLDAGKRLTIAAQSPPDYDLRRK